MTFKDHFSSHSDQYAKYRPSYPDSLYNCILKYVKGRNLAWDCATGTGQVAASLAPHFDKVIATDASENQITQTKPHPKVDYRVAPAEHSGLRNHSVDMITVAQAVHWFDFNAFYKEVKRVSKSGALLAIWTYRYFNIQPNINDIIKRYRDIIKPYWPTERQYVEDGYETIPFPFEQIKHPELKINLYWDQYDLIGYLHTWSSSQLFLKEMGTDPVLLVMDDLEKAWPNPSQKKYVDWPIILKMAYIA